MIRLSRSSAEKDSASNLKDIVIPTLPVNAIFLRQNQDMVDHTIRLSAMVKNTVEIRVK